MIEIFVFRLINDCPQIVNQFYLLLLIEMEWT